MSWPSAGTSSERTTEGVQQHAERHDERDLREEQDRQHPERRERRREDDAGAGDHAAGHGETAQDPGRVPCSADSSRTRVIRKIV